MSHPDTKWYDQLEDLKNSLKDIELDISGTVLQYGPSYFDNHWYDQLEDLKNSLKDIELDRTGTVVQYGPIIYAYERNSKRIYIRYKNNIPYMETVLKALIDKGLYKWLMFKHSYEKPENIPFTNIDLSTYTGFDLLFTDPNYRQYQFLDYFYEALKCSRNKIYFSNKKQLVVENETPLDEKETSKSQSLDNVNNDNKSNSNIQIKYNNVVIEIKMI
jgi:hypothetical protein